MHARLRAHIHVQSCTCPPDGFCIAPDTIAYAKVSGADSIAWRTQLHLTPALLRAGVHTGSFQMTLRMVVPASLLFIYSFFQFYVSIE